jgi:hypothetical protein
MSKHYSEDIYAGSATQLHPIEGGAFYFDCDEKIADCGPEENHQLHFNRFLSDEEIAMIDFLNGEDCFCNMEDFEGEFDRCWLDCGPLSLQARAYIQALRA